MKKKRKKRIYMKMDDKVQQREMNVNNYNKNIVTFFKNQ